MKTINEDLFNTFIDFAILEDLGEGDHSSLSCIPPGSEGKLELLVKDKGIIAGIEIASRIFQKIDRDLDLRLLLTDGALVRQGDIVLTVRGNLQSIFKAERLVLNVMQRMSGIATRTAEYVGRLEGLKTRILDTRKTCPGIRLLDKEAVRIGGGINHRMGLYDMILLKDNHIDFAGGIGNAIVNAGRYIDALGKKLGIVIETRNLNDVKEVLSAGNVQRIMFDNFSIPDTRSAVKMIAHRFETESSGGITLENLRDYALCGVDYISVGALTHEVKSLDLSLKATR